MFDTSLPAPAAIRSRLLVSVVLHSLAISVLWQTPQFVKTRFTAIQIVHAFDTEAPTMTGLPLIYSPPAVAHGETHEQNQSRQPVSQPIGRQTEGSEPTGAAAGSVPTGVPDDIQSLLDLGVSSYGAAQASGFPAGNIPRISVERPDIAAPVPPAD